MTLLGKHVGTSCMQCKYDMRALSNFGGLHFDKQHSDCQFQAIVVARHSAKFCRCVWEEPAAYGYQATLVLVHVEGV